jgi:hypothetical protein
MNRRRNRFPISYSRQQACADLYGLQECVLDGHGRCMDALAKAVRDEWSRRTKRASNQGGASTSGAADDFPSLRHAAFNTTGDVLDVDVLPCPAPLTYILTTPARFLLNNFIVRLSLDACVWANSNFLEAVFGSKLAAIFDHPIGQYLYVLTGAAWIFGNTTLVRKEKIVAVLAHDVLKLGHFRVASRALLVLTSGRRVWFINTHLHDGRSAEKHACRGDQIELIINWMTPAEQRADGVIFTG